MLLTVTLGVSLNSHHPGTEEFVGQSVGAAEGRRRELLQGPCVRLPVFRANLTERA